MANVLLFTGVETFGWQLTDFDRAIQWCKNHRIDGLIVKVYEVTQGEWYMGLGGSSVVVNHIRASGLDCLPYGYYYGVSPSELASISFFLAKHGKYCLNLEAEWDGNPNNMIGTLATALSNHPGDLWVSTWANPAEHGWLDNIRTLDPFVSVWMPEEYNDSLTTKRLSQFPTVQGKVCPTYKVNSSTITRMVQTDTPSLWEYIDALANPVWVDAAIAHIKAGGTPVQLDSNGCVVTVVKSFQLEENESEDLCGPWAAYATAMAVPPGQAPLTDAEKIDQFTDQMVDDYGTAHGNAFNHINWPGSLDSDMIWFLNYVRDHTNRIHYQVIPATINNVRTAIQAGYPVLFSCNELDIIEERTGQVPYPWRSDNPLSWPQGFNAQNFGGNVPMNWPSLGMQQQAQDTWLISAKFLQAAFGNTAPYTTGIALAWQNAYKSGKNYGPPVCTEQNSVDWNNKPIKVQLFAGGVRAEWDGSIHWYDKDGPLT